jgi:hypothetical protein
LRQRAIRARRRPYFIPATEAIRRREDRKAQVGIADFEAGNLPAERRESREAGQTRT